MSYQAKHPAAYINVIAEEGTKAAAIEYLQRTWDELADKIDALNLVRQELHKAKLTIKALEEYKAMYEGLCK